MLSLSERRPSPARKKQRPLNPQVQRLWDVEYSSESLGDGRPEPSYSANKAPLVVRARTLQKRLNGLPNPLHLKETSVPHVMDALNRAWQLELSSAHAYRSFESGLDLRRSILAAFHARGEISNRSSGLSRGIEIQGDFADCFEELAQPVIEIEEDVSQELLDQVSKSVENFHAFVTAWVGALIEQKRVRLPTEDLAALNSAADPGWVYLPCVERLKRSSRAHSVKVVKKLPRKTRWDI